MHASLNTLTKGVDVGARPKRRRDVASKSEDKQAIGDPVDAIRRKYIWQKKRLNLNLKKQDLDFILHTRSFLRINDQMRLNGQVYI